MPALSAGLLMVRRTGSGIEFLLAHPGGPFFARRDDGAWSIPKGLVEPGEDLLAAARREFAEETGLDTGDTDYVDLGQVRQKSGKIVAAFAVEGDCDPAALSSNTFEIEWPRGSGNLRSFPEIDRFGWFDESAARRKLLAAQIPFLDRARDRLR